MLNGNRFGEDAKADVNTLKIFKTQLTNIARLLARFGRIKVGPHYEGLFISCNVQLIIS